MRWCNPIFTVLFFMPLFLNGQVKPPIEIEEKLHRADSLFEIERFEESFALYTEVYSGAKETKDEVSEAYALKGLGNIAYMFSDLVKAEECYESALEIFTRIGEKRGEIKILINLGNIHSEKNEKEEAMKRYKEALEVLRTPEFSEGEDQEDKVAVLGNIGSVYQVSYDLDSALYYFSKAYELAREIRFKKGEGDNLHNIGNIHFLMNRFDDARQKYTHSKEIFEEMGNVKGVADNLRELGAVERKEGKYAESLLYLQEALDTYRRLGKESTIIGETVILSNIALVYFEIGKFEESLNYLKKEKELYENKGDSVGIAYVFENMGNVFFKMMDFEEEFGDSAVVLYKRSLEILRKKQKGIEEANVMNNIGLVFQERGEIEEALDKFEIALEKYREEGYTVGQAQVYSNIANIYMEKKEYGKAVENFKKASDLVTEFNLPGFRATILASLGLAYKKAEMGEKGIAFLSEAIGIIEDIRGNLVTQELKSTFIEDKIRIYEELIDILLKRGEIEEAFLYVERSKSRAFLDMLGQRDIRLRGIPPDAQELVKRERLLAKKVELLTDEEEKQEAFFAHQKILHQLKKVYPDYHSLRVVEPIDLEGFQKSIDSETIVLEYFLCHGGVYLFAVDNKTVSAQKLDYTPGDLYEDVVWMRRYMYGRGDWETLASTLYEKLVSVVRDELKEKKRICIIPHGILHHLPFNSLLVEKEPKKYLVEDFDLCYAPSASILTIAREKNTKRRERSLLLAKSDFTEHDWKSLDSTIAEAKRLSSDKLLPGVEVYLDEEATEDRVKSISGKFDILHFATHGQLNVEEPLQSRLLLTPSEKNDGSLTVSEIFGLELNANLVTMSACETGEMGSYITGKEFSAGDDLVGLTRSFIFAGSPSVVASLWLVVDATAVPLMVEFYRNLKKYDKAKSLCEAQRYMINESDFPSPKFWSPFVLFGDWE
jgi:CHAT domain-containing protein/predicted negative regulator of RcsB-dependent stress response